MTLLPAELAMAFMPFVHGGVLGGPNITPCSGCTATEPAPATTAAVLSGATHNVTVDDG